MNPNIHRNSYVPYTGKSYICRNGHQIDRTAITYQVQEHPNRSIVFPTVEDRLTIEEENPTSPSLYSGFYANCNYSANNLFR